MVAAPRRSPLAACRVAAAVGSLLPWAAHVQAQPKELVLTGTCSHDPQDMLEGLAFRMQGRTKSGAPWYQSTEYGQYLYYDPDCSGGGDGEGWIIDSKKPSVTADKDLDADGSCNYRARVRHGGTGAPPKSAFWFIKCRDRWMWRGLRLSERPEAHEAPAAGAPGGLVPAKKDGLAASRPRPGAKSAKGELPQAVAAAAAAAQPAGNSTVEEEAGQQLVEGALAETAAAHPEEAPEAAARGKGKGGGEEPESASVEEPKPKGPKKLVLNGACEMKAELNGAVFELQGRTRSGAPYYKAAESDEFLYHVTTCDGPDDTKTPSVWVLDTEEPKKFKKGKKKTAKTKCDYNAAHLEEAILNGPPATATWKMWCGKDKVLDLVITLVAVPDPNDSEPSDHTLVLVSGTRRMRGFLAALALSAAALLARR